MAKIVWVSDYSQRIPATGFSRVSSHVLKYLHEKDHSVFEVGVGYEGQKHEAPWPVYSTTMYGGRLEGQDVAPIVARDVGADALVLFMDVPDAAWAVVYVDRKGNPLQDAVVEALDSRSFALLMYSPVDGHRIDGTIPDPWPYILSRLNTFDGLAAPSRFGQKLLGDGAVWLPHGVDPSFFAPGDRVAARSRLGLPPDNFTLTYVATNRRRKSVPSFFEAVSKFLERQPEAHITTIFCGNEREDHYDLQGLADSYRLEARRVVCYSVSNLTNEGLVILYHASDLLVHLSGSEGFAVPVVEAQACRLPVIATDYSAMSENVTDAERGFCRVPVKALVPQPANNLCYALPDTDAAAERIEAFYLDKGLRVRLRKAAWEFAQRYAWPNVLPRLEKWILETAERKQSHQSVRIEAV